MAEDDPTNNKTHEERTKNREQRETTRPHRTHDYRTTIAELEPSPNHIHQEREKREGEEKEERTEKGEECENKKVF